MHFTTNNDTLYEQAQLLRPSPQMRLWMTTQHISMTGTTGYRPSLTPRHPTNRPRERVALLTARNGGGKEGCVVPGCLIIRPSSTINITLQGTCKHYILWTSSFRQREQKGNTRVEEASLLRTVSSSLVHLAHALDRFASSISKRTRRHAPAIERPPIAFRVQDSNFQGYFKLLFYPSPSSRENHSGCRRGGSPLLTTVSCENSK